MFSSQAGRDSIDSLTTPTPPGSRPEFPSHRSSQGHHSRTASRRSSSQSLSHSVGGTLDTAPGSWVTSIHESGQNAISTLLQPPILRTGLVPHTAAPASSSHKPPTYRDIPPVTLTNIPHVNSDDFAPYLAQVSALYEQLRRVKESEEDLADISRPDDQLPDPGAEIHLRPSFQRSQNVRRGSAASITSLSSSEAAAGSSRRPSTGFSRRQVQGPPPLSTIPSVYFEEDFHLENPRTFDVVSERSEVIRPPMSKPTDKIEDGQKTAAPRKALATNAILQEKMSWYMDTIEVHLINSISTASTTFFTALGSLKELHSEAAESVQRICTLRKELLALDEEIALSGIQVAQKRRRRENLQRLNETVRQLQHIVEGIAKCASLASDGELDKSLSQIEMLERRMAGEEEVNPGRDGEWRPEQLRDLRSASALQGVHAELAAIRTRIGKAYEAQFSGILMADVRRHVESVSNSDVLLRWGNAANRSRGANHGRSPSLFPAYLGATDGLRTQLRASMIGLDRAQHMAVAAAGYREAVVREVRSVIRRHLPSSSDDDNESMVSVSTTGGAGKSRSNQEKSITLARNLRALEAEEAEAMLTSIYVGVTETLRRLTTQAKVLLDMASSLRQPQSEQDVDGAVRSPTIASPRIEREEGQAGAGDGSYQLQEALHASLDVAGLLTQTVDVANEKVVKILRVRSSQTTHLPLELFLRFFTLNLYFSNECEAISGGSGTSLRTVVNNQIREFVQRNREAEMQKLAQGMEADQWGVRDFGEEKAELLKRILEPESLASAWTESTKIWLPHDDEGGGREARAKREPATEQGNGGGGGKDKTRAAVIGSEKFLLPRSAILCLDGIGNFMQLMAGIPSMTGETTSSLVAFLQLFNSRCTQLILGAGATRSAGLKNITTKHLALAWQALAFVAALLPRVGEFARRQAGGAAGATGPVGELDKVRRQLQEHQESIQQKLVDIMSGRAAMHAKSIKALDWDSEASEKGPHAYAETLAKETTTLHRVLTKHLPETCIQMIMQPVFDSYKDHLGAAFGEAEAKTEGGQKSMLRDVDFLSGTLSKLDGFGAAGKHLEDVVKAKEVKHEAAATTTETTTTTAETTATTTATTRSRSRSRSRSPSVARETVANEEMEGKEKQAETKKETDATEEAAAVEEAKTGDAEDGEEAPAGTEAGEKP